MKPINRVLIANRGEIALRIIRTCRERGIETVSVYSTPDAAAPHVLAADQSVHIGEAASSESYLDMQKIIQAAENTGADAIHPGYGFLSENAAFASLCNDHGITFIGPNPESIQMMGDKTRARELMGKAGVPYPPGTVTALEDVSEASDVAKRIGYPVLIKAAAGGGGKGMRIVYDEKSLESAIKTARSEAKNSFGDSRVFVEKYLEEPRHIEFQIFADYHGNYVHLFERECSVQRRHQKVIEEAPSAAIDDELRHKMADAAIAAAKSCNYVGAGTVEFLVDKHKKFYFLEMNTRLQVEHPVTEMITGLDLVSMQIDIAEGKKLPVTQENIIKRGHAIECRIYAEDPADNFLPSTGTLTRHRIPSGPGVRVDAGIEEGREVSVHYDPLISKVCAHAESREMAIEKMLRALGEYEISGVRTTIPFCKFAVGHDAFRKGTYDTHFVQNHFKPEMFESFDEMNIAAVVSSMVKMNHQNKPSSVQTADDSVNMQGSLWWKKRKS